MSRWPGGKLLTREMVQSVDRSFECGILKVKHLICVLLSITDDQFELAQVLRVVGIIVPGQQPQVGEIPGKSPIEWASHNYWT